MQLEHFGWSSFFAEAFAAYAVEGFVPARVNLQERGGWFVWSLAGEHLVQHCRSGVTPVTGDWVVLRGDGSSIEAVLPRRVELVRKDPSYRSAPQVLAANVDVVFVVMGLDGDFNLRRLERYLLLCRQSGARPVVILNKSDLSEDWLTCVRETEAISGGAAVCLISALHQEGIGALTPVVDAGETVALLGSSGAGKSTLLNALRGSESQKTQPVREGDSRGRHTTTQRQLIRLDNGWLLMDLPGLREIQPLGEAGHLDSVFDDITELAKQCRFADCRHSGEPGCAVVQGVAPERLASFQKLSREADWLARQSDKGAQLAEKARWKAIHRSFRHHPKYRQTH